MRKNFIPILLFGLLTLIGIFAMKALLHDGFYTSHDGWHQVARLYHFNKAIVDGQFPPRWSGDLLNGFGYPLFIFSYHVPWWLAQIPRLFNADVFTSIKFVFLITYVISGWVMYGWIKDMWGRKAAFLSALIYLLTPYRFANILVRANIGEAVSFMFFPLIFWSWFRLARRSSFLSIVVGVIGIAGSLLSHVMILPLFAVPLLLYFLVILITVKSKLVYLRDVAVTGILGIGLSAYYLLPATAYKSMTVFSKLYHGLYKEYFTPLSKLIYSPWGYSAIGQPGEMSRQVGLVILGISVLVTLILIWLIFFKKRFQKFTFIGLIILASLLLGVFMMTKASLPLWKVLEPLSLIDFPWRFLAVTTLCGSVLAGFLVLQIQKQLVQLALIILVTAGLVITNRNYIRVNQYTQIPLSLYIDSEVTTNTDDEYLPVWVNREEAKKMRPLIASEASVSGIKKTSDSTEFIYTSDKITNLQIHQMYFPGWTANIDGKLTTIEKTGAGGIKIRAPSGTHQVRLEYRPTLPMRLGEVITLAAFATIIIGLLYRRLFANLVLKGKTGFKRKKA